jgi:biopolymer transport protein ExbB
MTSKHLTIAAAIVFLSAMCVGQAIAQPAAAPAPAATAPTTPADAGTPAPGAPAPDATAAPAAAPPAAAPAAAPEPAANPYGIGALWGGNGKPDWVARAVMTLLAIMSIGTWYISFMKYWEQSRILGQAKQVERRFWSSNNLNEGIDRLAKNSVFRSVAEAGVRASTGGSGLVNASDWIGMSLNRQMDEINSRLQSGVAFLASVGSTAPFVGLFGTVWGILNALIAIGVAGQATIEKVAGPVGEALIMTALGLFVAVPAVLLYNFLVNRNKVINQKLKSFSGDLQTYLVTNKK